VYDGQPSESPSRVTGRGGSHSLRSLPLIGDVSEYDTRQFDNKPSKPCVFFKQRQRTVRIQRQNVVHKVVTPILRISDVSLVARFHGLNAPRYKLVVLPAFKEIDSAGDFATKLNQNVGIGVAGAVRTKSQAGRGAGCSQAKSRPEAAYGSRARHLISSATCHLAYGWLYDPSFLSTKLDFDRRRRNGPTHRGGRLDRSRLTQMQA
jgi:hypothetical protein